MRHPVYISDAVRGLELCACTPGVNGEVFIIAGESALPVAELVSVISRELGVRPPKLHLPIAIRETLNDLSSDASA
jgi:nucleoside-diphosphate-sugar epimerase